MVDPRYNSVCPIKLLIIHGLRRHAMCQADSVDSVMQQGKSKGVLVWKSEVLELPVICAIDTPGKKLLYDRPASALQVLNTVKRGGIYAGILAPIVSHDLRRGSAGDFPKLTDDTKGVATVKTALQMGHTATSYAKGVTQKYVGALKEDHWGPRLATSQADGVDLFGLQLAEGPLKMQRNRTDDVEAECRKRGIDPQDRSARENVRRSMTKQRTANMLNNTSPALHDPTTVATAGAPSRSIRPPLMGKSANASAETSKRRKLNHVDTDSLIDPMLLQYDTSASVSSQIDAGDSAEDGAANTAIDGLEDADPAAENIQNILQGSTLTPVSNDIIDVLVSNDDSQSLISVITAPAMKFMTYFTDINVVATKILDEGQTRFEYSCKNSIHGCPYKNVFPKEMVTHEPKCPYDGVYIPTERPFACTQCPSTFKTKDDLTVHVGRWHDWKQRKCPKCPDGPVYTERKELRKHQEAVHAPSSRFQAQKCNAPGCTSEHIFKNERNFKKHLDGVHHLVGEELRRHIEMARAPAIDDNAGEEE